MARAGAPPRELKIGDRALPLQVRRHARARHMTLRLTRGGDGIVLTLPRAASMREGMAFVEEKAGWILSQIAAAPDRVPFADGATIPIFGVEHVIAHVPDARRGVWQEDARLHVSGDAAHVARRVTDWLKAEAKREISARVRGLATGIDRPVARVTVRDTTSRWGSCAAGGRLSFSWRLILAPTHVFDYVIAHEVAHLAHMNHGKRFWALVDRLTPHRADATRWLNRHGESLHRYG